MPEHNQRTKPPASTFPGRIRRPNGEDWFQALYADTRAPFPFAELNEIKNQVGHRTVDELRIIDRAISGGVNPHSRTATVKPPVFHWKPEVSETNTPAGSE